MTVFFTRVWEFSMAGKGPAKTPTAVLENRGSRLVRDRQAEPVYNGISNLRQPIGLGYHGKKIWNRLLPMLANQGVLTDADIAGFERYCFLWQVWKDLAKAKDLDINKLMKIESGFSKLEQQFGLTPASRPNIKATKIVKEENKTKRFLQVG
jgi:phage terminase small subunit